MCGAVDLSIGRETYIYTMRREVVEVPNKNVKSGGEGI